MAHKATSVIALVLALFGIMIAPTFAQDTPQPGSIACVVDLPPFVAAGTLLPVYTDLNMVEENVMRDPGGNPIGLAEGSSVTAGSPVNGVVMLSTPYVGFTFLEGLNCAGSEAPPAAPTPIPPPEATPDAPETLPEGWTHVDPTTLPTPNGYIGFRGNPPESHEANDGIPRDVEFVTLDEDGWTEFGFIAGDTATIPVPGVGEVGENEQCYVVMIADPISFDTQPTDGQYPPIHWPGRSQWDLHWVWDTAEPMAWLAQKTEDLRQQYPATCGVAIDIWMYDLPDAPREILPGWQEIDEATLPASNGMYAGYNVNNPVQQLLPNGQDNQVPVGSIALVFGNVGVVNAQEVGNDHQCFLAVAVGPATINVQSDSAAVELHQVESSFDALDWLAEKYAALVASYPQTCALGTDVLLYNPVEG